MGATTNTFEIDVSRLPEGLNERSTPAVLHLKTNIKTPKQALDVFRTVVGNWLCTTKSGKQAWKDSVRDFNYGDFSDHESNRTLHAMLKKAGIESASVGCWDALDLGEHFDHVFKGPIDQE